MNDATTAVPGTAAPTAASRLANRDYFVVVDKSGSMEETDTPTGQSRFDYAKESTIAIANTLQKYDPDGITVIPFAGNFKCYDNTTPAKVKDIFAENQPFGGTVLAPVLQHIFNVHLDAKAKGTMKANGSMIVVITDGASQDETAVAKTISEFTQKLDNGDDEIGIAFFQVGKDPAATRFLKKLDDDLVAGGAKYDVVDTKTFEEIETIGLTEALIAALDD